MQGGLRAIEANCGLFQPILARLQSDLSELLTMCRFQAQGAVREIIASSRRAMQKSIYSIPVKNKRSEFLFRVSGIDGMLTR